MEAGEIAFARMATMLPDMAQMITRRFARLSPRMPIKRW